MSKDIVYEVYADREIGIVELCDILLKISSTSLSDMGIRVSPLGPYSGSHSLSKGE